MSNKFFFKVFILFLFFSCSSKDENKKEIIDGILKCKNATILISEKDSIAFDDDDSDPIYWVGAYNETSVKISFTKDIGFDDVTERHTFVFDKINGCLKIAHAYKYYDGKKVDISAITGLEYLQSFTQDWEVDKKFTGHLSYMDPHNGKTYIRKFWVEFSEEDYLEDVTNSQLFANCFSSRLPIEIDMNNDGNTDFRLDYDLIRNTGNNPSYSEYTIKLISSDNSINYILSPKRNSSPYSVIFEPPFSSRNTKQYFNGVKNALDVFYEFDSPYNKYNYFLNNNLTYTKNFNNNIDDYYVVSLILDGEQHFGWIKFQFNSNNCSIDVLETYLNPNPNQHINVD